MSEGAIFDLYRSLKLWTNPICERCKVEAEPTLSGPIGIWQVGSKYKSDPYRVVFVGKNARGSIHDHALGDLAKQGFIDATTEADKWIEQTWSAYWNYTAGIIENLFGSLEEGWEHVAFTNLVKCNNSMNVDNTSWATKSKCLDELRVTWREFEILRPRHIILFSGRDYDDFIERYTSGFRFRDVTDKDHKVPNGQKHILWWERHCFDQGNRKFRVLRTSHPERQRKGAFTEKIARWVKSGDA